MLGYTVEEMVGRSMFAFMDDEGRVTAARNVERRRGGLSEHHPFRLQHRSGRAVWTEMASWPLPPLDGRYRGAIAFVQDVTERLRLDAERARMTEELSIIAEVFEKAPMGIQLYDAEGGATRMNLAMAELFGLADRTVGIGRFNVLTDPGAIESGMSDLFRRVYAGETVFDEYPVDLGRFARQVQPDRRLRRLEILAFPVLRADGTVLAAVGMVRDVTERREVDRRLFESQRLESLGTLAGGIAHDFNNLLAAILGNLELALLESPQEGRPSQRLQTAARTCRRAAELTQQLLVYAGRGRSEKRTIDLDALIRETVELLRVSLSRQAEFRMELDAPRLRVLGDVGQLRQVVMNLVTNASDALDGKPGVVRLHTTRRRSGGAGASVGGAEPASEEILIEVSDNGRGMDRAVLPHIFDPFYTTRPQGRGLGLSAVLGIVRGHGGSIEVDSALGEGSTFRVVLPAFLVEPTEPVEPVGGEAVGEGRRVLVVDDEASVREVTSLILRSAGFLPVEAVDGLDAIEIFGRHPEQYAAVVLDLSMPRVGGAEAYARMRSVRRDTPILVCSGYASEGARIPPAGDANAGFLAKPFSRRILLERLRALLDPAQARDGSGP